MRCVVVGDSRLLTMLPESAIRGVKHRITDKKAEDSQIEEHSDGIQCSLEWTNPRDAAVLPQETHLGR